MAAPTPSPPSEWTQEKVYTKFPNVHRDALFQHLDQPQRAWFTKLENQTPNTTRCTFIKLNLYLMLCTDDFKDVREQFAKVGSCG